MTRWLLVAALVLFAAGCTGTPSPALSPASATTRPTPVNHPTSGSTKPFHGTRWVLDHVVTDAGETIPGPTSYTAYLRFDGRRVVGSGGCGEFSGTMTEKANILRFTNLRGTPIPCPSSQAETMSTMFQVLEADSVTFLFEGGPAGSFLRLHAGSLTLFLR